MRDRATLEPATAECYAICDRLRELGVIVQPTGERANVLKMKPPMCLTLEAADLLARCRLRDVQVLCREREAAAFDDAAEQLELADVHRQHL